MMTIAMAYCAYVLSSNCQEKVEEREHNETNVLLKFSHKHSPSDTKWYVAVN